LSTPFDAWHRRVRPAGRARASRHLRRPESLAPG